MPDFHNVYFFTFKKAQQANTKLLLFLKEFGETL